jgi:DNA polymerase-3 subunit gamma/tau
MGGSAPVAAAPAAPAAQKPIPEVVAVTEAIAVVPVAAAPASAPVEVAHVEVASAPGAQLGAVTTQQFKDSWAEILTLVNKASKSAWMVAFSLSVIDFTDDVLTLKFMSQKDLESLKNSAGASDVLRKAIFEVLGVQVKFKPLVTEAPAEVAAPKAQPVAKAYPTPATKPIAVVQEVAPPVEDEPIEATPIDEPQAAEPAAEAQAAEPAAKKTTKSRNSGMADESARYGESLLREMLGAEPIPDKNGGR